MWKNIAGYEGRYEVSDTGQIRKAGSKKIIGQWINDAKYMIVRLSRPRKMFRVHRLVAAAFIDNPKNKPYINHIDCNRSNNNVQNLEWCSQLENLQHASKLGRMKRDYWKGRRSPNAKVSEDMVQLIRNEYAAGGVSWETIGKKYNVSKRTVGRIIKEESYV